MTMSGRAFPTDQQRRQCHRMVGELLEDGFAVACETRDVGCVSYTIRRFEVVIRFALLDHQVSSDVVILSIGVSPNFRGAGLGSAAVAELVQWATRNNLDREIRATQVSNPRAARFWEKCGFQRAPDPNPCGDYLRLATREPRP